MKIEIYNINDKKKLTSWLEAATMQLGYEHEELNETVQRLKNEVEYYEAHNYREPKFKDVDKELPINDERVEELNKLLQINYEKAFKLLDDYGPINDETIAYSDLSTFNNDESIKQNVSDLLECLMHFTHLKLNNISEVEFYNDEVDNWKYRGEEPGSYFFPHECFLYKFQDRYVEYSELHGQGTISEIRLVYDLEQYGNSFGHNLEKTKRKIIIIE